MNNMYLGALTLLLLFCAGYILFDITRGQLDFIEVCEDTCLEHKMIPKQTFWSYNSTNLNAKCYCTNRTHSVLMLESDD